MGMALLQNKYLDIFPLLWHNMTFSGIMETVFHRKANPMSSFAGFDATKYGSESKRRKCFEISLDETRPGWYFVRCAGNFSFAGICCGNWDGCCRNPNENQPLGAGFDESQLNPEYLEWLENGKEGAAPSMQDFSYLAESYARLHTARNAAVLPAEYDLRDYGRVTPVINQGTLNLCWAVAASDATAGTLLEQFPQMAFSATHTAWFSKLGAEEYEYFQQDSPYDYGGTDGTVVGSWAA